MTSLCAVLLGACLQDAVDDAISDLEESVDTDGVDNAGGDGTYDNQARCNELLPLLPMCEIDVLTAEVCAEYGTADTVDQGPYFDCVEETAYCDEELNIQSWGDCNIVE